MRGSLAETKNNGVGIVGSRYATPYGRAVSERFGRELAASGVTVVSGGAVGIDTAAHRGAALSLPAVGQWRTRKRVPGAAGWMWTTRSKTESYSRRLLRVAAR